MHGRILKGLRGLNVKGQPRSRASKETIRYKAHQFGSIVPVSFFLLTPGFHDSCCHFHNNASWSEPDRVRKDIVHRTINGVGLSTFKSTKGGLDNAFDRTPSSEDALSIAHCLLKVRLCLARTKGEHSDSFAPVLGPKSFRK